MGNELIVNALYPSVRLQVVVCADGSMELLKQRNTPAIKLGAVELEIIAALSAGKIADPEQGLQSYLGDVGYNPEQCERACTLITKLVRQRRVDACAEPLVASGTVDRETYSAVLPEGPLTLRTPCVYTPRAGAFELVTHDGTRLPAINVVQLDALRQLVKQPSLKQALQAHQQHIGDGALNMEQFRQLLQAFVAHHFVVPQVEKEGISSVELSGAVLSGSLSDMTRQRFRAHAEAQDEAEAKREARTGRRRTRIIPVAFDMTAPAGVGAIMASAKASENGALDEFYNFRTDWIWDPERLPKFTTEPAIYLFSNYLWSHRQCIEVSAKIKELSPNSITIHGGPDTPKYEGDEQRYFADNPHIDITVRGEGELTAAQVLSKLREVIGDDEPNLEVLEGVEGCSYRRGRGLVRNPDRPRVKDLNELPSAYLMGLFDAYIGLDDFSVVLETNRGCPYGCTFCDWGSATASKIRKFDLDRVMAEIEWTSQAKVASVSIADANFGIFPRDVEIARKAAQLKNATGFPRGFGGNYAKNTVKYLRNIIDVLAEGNILTLGTLSLQTMDEETLDTICRSNIKTEKYDALAVEMRKADLPLTIELMMGLPGSTVESFREDLQQCIDRELPVRVNMTTLLVNSPMNAPGYVEKHQIKTNVPVAPGNDAMLASTASYSNDDLKTMVNLRSAYQLFENYGVLRVVARFVRQETDSDEMSFYEKLLVDTLPHQNWPMLHLLTVFVPGLMAPPVSWSLVMEELGHYLVAEYGITDTPALHAVLAAQLACLPAHDRCYPEVKNLECDVVGWYSAITAEKESGNRRGWTDTVPRLETYGPGSITVDDPLGLTEKVLGINRELNAFGVTWELDSPLHRARADLV